MYIHTLDVFILYKIRHLSLINTGIFFLLWNLNLQHTDIHTDIFTCAYRNYTNIHWGWATINCGTGSVRGERTCRMMGDYPACPRCASLAQKRLWSRGKCRRFWRCRSRWGWCWRCTVGGCRGVGLWTPARLGAGRRGAGRPSTRRGPATGVLSTRTACPRKTPS